MVEQKVLAAKCVICGGVYEEVPLRTGVDLRNYGGHPGIEWIRNGK